MRKTKGCVRIRSYISLVQRRMRKPISLSCKALRSALLQPPHPRPNGSKDPLSILYPRVLPTMSPLNAPTHLSDTR